MAPASPWLLWQLTDSAFPAGGFAHSSGLETAAQLGEIRTEGELERIVREGLDQAGHTTLPLMSDAYRLPARLPELATLIEATLTNHVARRASLAQGSALLSSSVSAFERQTLRALRQRLLMDAVPQHYAPLFGVVSRELDVLLDEAQRAWLFIHLRGAISSAVRLGLVGPLAGQALQHRLGPVADDVLKRCAILGSRDVAQTAPLLDLYQGHHDRLYSRLFSS